MKYFCWVLFYLLIYGRLLGQPITAIVLEKEYENAVQFFEQHPAFAKIAEANNIEPAFVFALVFPELMRYNKLSDYFETSALEVFYIQYGKKYANFSIGRFQIKPAFAEILDSLYYALGFYNSKNIEFSEFAICNLQNYSCRTSRIQRLKSIDCQWKYIVLFYLILQKIHKDIIWKDAKEKLKFYATAYNCGEFFNASRIMNYQQKQYYHLSNFNSKYCYNYSVISCFFYEKYKDKIVKQKEVFKIITQ